MTLLSKEELEKQIDFVLDRPYAIVTFHPVTLEKNDSQKQFKELLSVVKKLTTMKFIFTKANADGRVINRMIDDFAVYNNHVAVFESLGTLKYLSALSVPM